MDQNDIGPESGNKIGNLSLKDLEHAISNLLSKPDLPLEKLGKSPSLLANYQRLLSFEKYLDKNNFPREDLEKYEKIIKKQYMPATIKQGTIGSYIYGCYYQDHGDLEQKCSPNCIRGMKYKNIEKCEYQIWHLKKNELIWLNKKPRPPIRAYLYVEDDFEGLTREHLKDMENQKVNSIVIFKRDNDRFYKISKRMRLKNIRPIDLEKNYLEGFDAYETNDNEIDKKNGNEFFGIILLVLFIFLVISFFAWYYYKYRRKKNLP